MSTLTSDFRAIVQKVLSIDQVRWNLPPRGLVALRWGLVPALTIHRLAGRRKHLLHAEVRQADMPAQPSTPLQTANSRRPTTRN